MLGVISHWQSTSAEKANEGDLICSNGDRRLQDLADQTHGNAHELKIDRSRRHQQESPDRKSGDRTQMCGDTADKSLKCALV
jgi:hypothetical protein